MDQRLSQRYKKRVYDILELTDPKGTKKSAPRKRGTVKS
jgi:hypothetical protein